MIEVRAGSATDVGNVRASNQDHLLRAHWLFAVADGMGGHAAGEVASEVAVTALGAAVGDEPLRAPEDLAEAVRAANRAVWDAAQRDSRLRGMGTTLVAAGLTGGAASQILAVVNVGDSRVYRYRGEQLEQLTVDHSLVAELVAEGRLPEEEARTHPQRSVLTRALGVDADVAVDLHVDEPVPGDRYLLCSDGLYRELSADQIGAVLRRMVDPGDAAHTLVADAKRQGGSDNITVVVVDVVDASHPSVATEAMAGTGPSPLGGRGYDPAALPDPLELPDPTATTGVVAVVPPEPQRDARETGAAARDGAHARRVERHRLITPRVIGFFALILAVLGAGTGVLLWYARDSYFVGLHGDRLTIFQGRPGGVLWLDPTVVTTSQVTTTMVETNHLPQLRAGQVEPSVGAARAFIQRLRAEYQAAVGASPSTTPTGVAHATASPTTGASSVRRPASTATPSIAP